MFKCDENLEKTGVWFEMPNGASFLVSRFGGRNDKLEQVHAKLYKPYAKLIEKNLLSKEKQNEIYRDAFIQACLLDWKGVEIDGEEVPFSQDAAKELLGELPELLDILVENAQNVDSFREDVGN